MMVSLVHRTKLLPVLLVVLNPAGTFFIPHCFKGNYDFELPYYFLVSMCDHACPCLLVFRLHFLSKSANDNADNPGSFRRIERNRDKKFCL
jgi:hypothetical protein